MKEIEKFKLGDDVVVSGLEGTYYVVNYFEQMIMGNGEDIFELWYTVKGNTHGDVREVSYQLVRASVEYEQNIINELLDEYNDYIELNRMFGDKEYKYKAEDIMDKLKYKK